MAKVKIKFNTDEFRLSEDGNTVYRLHDGAGQFIYSIGDLTFSFLLPQGEAGETVAMILDSGKVIPFYRSPRTSGTFPIHMAGQRKVREPGIDAPKPFVCLSKSMVAVMVAGLIGLGMVCGLAHGGERWDRAKPILFCATAGAIVNYAARHENYSCKGRGPRQPVSGQCTENQGLVRNTHSERERSQALFGGVVAAATCHHFLKR